MDFSDFRFFEPLVWTLNEVSKIILLKAQAQFNKPYNALDAFGRSKNNIKKVFFLLLSSSLLRENSATRFSTPIYIK